MNTKLNLQIGIITLIILLATFSRILPHPPNFSPLAAIGLFGAAHFAKKWLALAIPIIATWLSDLYINNVIYSQYYTEFTIFYQGFYWQYGTYLLITMIGFTLFQKISPFRVMTGSLTASLLFFLITNFGVWLGSSLYPQSFGGLIACYIAGIPFLQGTLLGDMFYSSILFGGVYMLSNRFPNLKPPHINYRIL